MKVDPSFAQLNIANVLCSFEGSATSSYVSARVMLCDCQQFWLLALVVSGGSTGPERGHLRACGCRPGDAQVSLPADR